MEIKFKTALSPFKKGQRVCYRAIAENNGIVYADEIARRVETVYGIKAATVKYHLGLIQEQVAKALADGKTVQITDLFNAKTVVKGSFPFANSEWDAAKNKLAASFSPNGSMRNVFADATAKNVNDTAKVYVRRVLDSVLRTNDEIQITQGYVLISGQGLNITAGADDEGIWLEDMEGTMLTIATIAANTETTADCTFPDGAELNPEDFPEGVRLCVSSRAGKPLDYAPAIAKRTVKLVAAPSTTQEEG